MNRLQQTMEYRLQALGRNLSTDAGTSDATLVIRYMLALDESALRQPPIAAQRALAVARNPASSSALLGAIFEQDPALTKGLLRMANSSYYHRGGMPCLAITEAIQRVGVRGVEVVVISNMVEGLMCRPGSAYSALLGQVWSHLTRTAPVARVLAPAFDVGNEEAFTLGLLHDVGKLVVFDVLTQLRTRHRREIRLPDVFLLDLLNRMHEPVGAMAALRWDLGAQAARAIACHHHEPPPEVPDRMAELLCVAEQTDHAIRSGTPLDLERLWEQRALTSNRERVRERLRRLDPPVPMVGRDDASGSPPSRAA
jgi:HD-like signal output (HDOD) protein